MNKFFFDSLMGKVFLALLLPLGVVSSDVVLCSTSDLINSYHVPRKYIRLGHKPPFQNFFHGKSWQMRGYAAFFPSTGGKQLYLAQKRQFVSDVASNDPGNPPNFANHKHAYRKAIDYSSIIALFESVSCNTKRW